MNVAMQSVIVRVTMNSCSWCGGPATLVSQTGVYACAQHVQVIRDSGPGGPYRGASFGPIPEKPAEKRDRLYRDELKQELGVTPDEYRIPIWQQEKGLDPTMKAQSVKQAEAEGREFAQLLRAIIQGTTDYKTVTKFAQYVAGNLLGYTSADLQNPWVTEFISEWLNPALPDSDPDGLNINTVNTLRKALGMPPLLGSPEGENNG